MSHPKKKTTERGFAATNIEKKETLVSGAELAKKKEEN